MSLIPDDVIEQIRDSADLVEIISETVPLKRTGADYRGGCPFHGGTHRNFAVIPKKGMYYCYVCHAAGDVFTYQMKRYGMDYPTAVREIARRVGIVIPERSEREGPDPREPLYSATALAQEWFAVQLRELPEAEAARQYLATRDIPADKAAEHGLGYAPKTTAFLEAMKRLGVAEQTQLEAGLLHRRDDGSVAPRFRGRLLFPIHDLRGRVVGFGGRLLGPGEPKYLNSPETPIFHKGGMLYNLHHAKHAIRKAEAVIVVEGYFDVLRLVLAGIDHVVAPLGTALTAEQAPLLKRFAATVVLLYDSDQAGLKATFRAGDEALRHGLRVRVATLPPGEDPDTLVQRGGAKAIEPILRDAMDILERKIQLLERRGWFEGVEHRRESLDRLLPTIRAASDPIARDLYLARVAERVGISREVLERELNSHPEPRAVAPAAPLPVPSGRPPATKQRRPGAGVEERLLRILLAAPTWRQRAEEQVGPERFDVPAFRTIFEALVRRSATESLDDVAGTLGPEVRAVWDRLADRPGDLAGLDLDAEFLGSAQALAERANYRTIWAIRDLTERRRRIAELPAAARERIFYWKQAEQARRRHSSRPEAGYSTED